MAYKHIIWHAYNHIVWCVRTWWNAAFLTAGVIRTLCELHQHSTQRLCLRAHLWWEYTKTCLSAHCVCYDIAQHQILTEMLCNLPRPATAAPDASEKDEGAQLCERCATNPNPNPNLKKTHERDVSKRAWTETWKQWSDKNASYLDLHLEVANSDIVTSLLCMINVMIPPSKLFNFPDLSGNIPRDGSYGVFIAQTLRYAKACAKYTHFMDRTLLLKIQLVQQHFESTAIHRKFRKWMERSEKAVVLKSYGRHTRDIKSDLRGLQRGSNCNTAETALGLRNKRKVNWP